MRKFLIKIAQISSVLLVIFILLDVLVFPNNKNPYTIKYNLLQDEAVETIVSGNSHLGFGIVADSLTSNAVNIANKARELETDIDILTSNISDKKRLKAILLSVSYYSLFKELDKEILNHSDQMRLYYNYYKINKYSQGLYKNSLLLNEPFRELVEDSYFLNFMKKDPFSAKGWRANDTKFVADSSIYGKIERLENSLNDRSVVDRNINRFKELIALCEKESIKLYLVLPPYSSYYYSITKHKYNTIIKEILHENIQSENCIIIDSNQFMTTDTGYYENSDHLNKKGALLYTRKIDSILKY